MSLTTPINAIPYPQNTDATNFPWAFQQGADQIDDRLVARFASIAARDAAIPSPIPGMVIFVQKASGAYALQMYHTTAGWVDIEYPTVKSKDTAETRTSTITPTADAELMFFAQANSTYIVEFKLSFQHASLNNVNALVRTYAPAGATASGVIVSQAANSTSASQIMLQFNATSDALTNSFTVGALFHVNIGHPADYRVKVVTAGTAGNVGLAWAQGVSNAGATTLHKNSYMKYIKAA